MPRPRDTIAALATPAGTAAIAVLRVSGPDAGRIAGEIFGRAPLPRSARHADYRDRSGGLLDDVLHLFFQGPHSYTGEDSFEVSCHGNPFIVQKILEDLLARGCRAAEPGEFTQRAFLNGRMDLSQAEAVMDLIRARSDRALAAAHQQLRGALARRLTGLVDGLLGVLARVEAYIDFPEEDLPPEDRGMIGREIERIARETEGLLATGRSGELLRDGIRTVIIGAPNAGKSSLLNRLVGRERALVSPEPGTTRDFIEARMRAGPHDLRLIDTAGLNPAPAAIEKLGIAKTLECAAEADLFLLVFDATQSAPPVPAELAVYMRDKNTLAILNKMDLVAAAPAANVPATLPVRRVSALTGAGIDELVADIVRCADLLQQDMGEDLVVINARHAHALTRVQICLRAAGEKLLERGPVELLAGDLRGALDAFGDVAGKIDNERMLDQLFATFCIGK